MPGVLRGFSPAGTSQTGEGYGVVTQVLPTRHPRALRHALISAREETQGETLQNSITLPSCPVKGSRTFHPRKSVGLCSFLLTLQPETSSKEKSSLRQNPQCCSNARRSTCPPVHSSNRHHGNIHFKTFTSVFAHSYSRWKRQCHPKPLNSPHLTKEGTICTKPSWHHADAVSGR